MCQAHALVLSYIPAQRRLPNLRDFCYLSVIHAQQEKEKNNPPFNNALDYGKQADSAEF